MESSRQITSKVVKSENSEPGASRVPQAVKGEIIGQLSAEKGMDEAAMESVAESGGGGPAATRQRSPRPSRTGVQLGNEEAF